MDCKSRYCMVFKNGYHMVTKKVFFGLFTIVVSMHTYHFNTEMALAQLQIQEIEG